MNRLVIRGICTLGRITYSGFRNEPAHFSLMVSRRLASSSSFLKLTETLDGLLANNLFSQLVGARRVRSAIYLLRGQPRLALSIIEDDCSAQGLVARSRALAFLGEYVQALECVQKAGHKGKRLASIYSDEIELLTQTVEVTRSNPTFSGNARAVLHLLTNSLPYTNSGYTQRTHSVLQSLQNEGWSVFAYTRLGYPWIVGQLPKHGTDVVNGVEYRRMLPSSLPDTPVARSSKQTLELSQAVREHRPSILHTTTEFVNGLSVLSVASKLNIPWVYEVRGQLADTWLSVSSDRQPDSFKYQHFKAQEAAVAQNADAVITLGAEMKRELVLAGVEPSKILVCPNAVGEEFIAELPDRQECRAVLGLEDDKLYIGTVSSLVGYEGLDVLVRSFATLVREYPHLRLLIVGDGVERSALMNLTREMGIAEQAIFPGRVEKELARKYHRALDVFVVPRLDLPVTRAVTPLKPVEAMAFEVPVVASDLPALREIISEGSDGLLFKPEDQEDLSKKLRLLLDDSGVRARMGHAGRKKVLETRTWASNAKKISELYAALIARN